MKILCALVSAALLGSCSTAKASFLNNESDLQQALEELRKIIGDYPRVLKIEVDADAVAIEAQDVKNLRHIDRWQYENRRLGPFSMRRVRGPQAVQPQLLDPDLEANLFDLDAVDFSATARLQSAATKRAGIREPALVTHMEIARRTIILPKPVAGDIIWTLFIKSDREHAAIFANPQGAIVGADLAGTERAKSIDLFREPELAADAASAFRASIGTAPVITVVGVNADTVVFGTNIPDKTLGKIMGGMSATSS